MELFDTTQIALERALAGSSLRQQALANNIANANTPGYQRVDVDFHQALADALQGAPRLDALQDGAALDAPADPAQVDQVSFAAVPTSTGVVQPDGNTVDIDHEMASLTENSLEYQALTSIMHTRLGMLQIAIGTRTS